MNLKPLVFLIFIFVLMSCGTKKIVTATGGTTDEATASVIKKHYEAEADFETLISRIRVRYQDDGQTQNVAVSLRMEKGKTIWLSASLLGFPLAKAKITPNRVQYYEKISKSYFDGDFSLLSNFLGTELDFQKVQNLLIGQAIYDLRKDGYVAKESNRGYQLLPKFQTEFFTKIFLINASTFKVEGTQLARSSENQSVTLTYPSYQDVDGQLFPNDISIVASEKAENTLIDISYGSIELNTPVRFPFEIPEGYDEIVLK